MRSFGLVERALLLAIAGPVAAFTVPVAGAGVAVVAAFSSNALSSYSSQLVVHPLGTKVATACALAVAGDALAQQRECAPYDTKRATSFVVFDAIYRGAFQHVTFPMISDAFQGAALHSVLSSVPTSMCAAVTRTVFNQCVIVPLIYYPLFFAVTSVVQGLSVEQGVDRARAKFWPLMSRNLLFWLPVQYCQFAFIDEAWQVPYVCVMGLVWNVILSAVAGNAEVPDACAVPEEGEAPAQELHTDFVGVDDGLCTVLDAMNDDCVVGIVIPTEGVVPAASDEKQPAQAERQASGK